MVKLVCREFSPEMAEDAPKCMEHSAKHNMIKFISVHDTLRK